MERSLDALNAKLPNLAHLICSHGITPTDEIVAQVSQELAVTHIGTLKVQAIHNGELAYEKLLHFQAGFSTPAQLQDAIASLMHLAPYVAKLEELHPIMADEDEERLSNRTSVADRMKRAPYKQSAVLQRGEHLPVFSPLSRILSESLSPADEQSEVASSSHTGEPTAATSEIAYALLAGQEQLQHSQPPHLPVAAAAAGAVYVAGREQQQQPEAASASGAVSLAGQQQQRQQQKPAAAAAVAAGALAGQQQQQQQPPQVAQVLPDFDPTNVMSLLSHLLRARRLLKQYSAGLLVNLMAAGYYLVPTKKGQADTYKLPDYIQEYVQTLQTNPVYIKQHASHKHLDSALQKGNNADIRASSKNAWTEPAPFVDRTGRPYLGDEPFMTVAATAKPGDVCLTQGGGSHCWECCRLCRPTKHNHGTKVHAARQPSSSDAVCCVTTSSSSTSGRSSSCCTTGSSRCGSGSTSSGGSSSTTGSNRRGSNSSGRSSSKGKATAVSSLTWLKAAFSSRVKAS